MEFTEPLLRDHKARATAAGPLAGKLPGATVSPPGEDLELTALNPKNQATNAGKKSEEQGSTKAAALAGKQHSDPSADALEDAPEKRVTAAAALAVKLKQHESDPGASPSGEQTSHVQKSEVVVQVEQESGNGNKNTDASDGKILASKVPQDKDGDQDLAVEKKQGHEAALTLESLREQAGAFANSAAGSSMAAVADAFSRAAEHFAGGKDRKKRVTETELSKAAMALFSLAHGAPSSEADLATVAMKLTSDAQTILLSDIDSKPGVFFSWWCRTSPTLGPEAMTRPSFKQRLRAAISASEPILPIHAEREEKLVDKRVVLYTLALGAPVAILTSAAGLHIFPRAWAWVAGASVGIWILTASGMVLNQYAQLDCERLAARHLGWLGMLGAALLFCFFTYSAFFPSVSWAFWLLFAIAAMAPGSLWILSCIRGDDEVSSVLGSAGDAAGRNGKPEMRRGGPARRRTT